MRRGVGGLRKKILFLIDMNSVTESDKSKRIAKEEVSKMRPSKSDTSISDSFVVVDSATAGAGGQNMLRSGRKKRRRKW